MEADVVDISHNVQSLREPTADNPAQNLGTSSGLSSINACHLLRLSTEIIQKTVHELAPTGHAVIGITLRSG